jgi:hypothetical protein
MYGLPADFDASIFIGRELVQVSFTTNTVHLVFDGDIAITVESSFVLQHSPGTEAVKQAPPVESSSLMALVGRQVRSAHADTDGTLTLRFDGGGTLACLDDSKDYESYHIRLLGKEIVV